MLNKLMKLKNKKGFTLVELIVVIAIIAILTAIIVPLVGRYSAQARYTTLNDAATTVSNSINNGLSDANQIGVINDNVITGTKTDAGILTVTVGAATCVSNANGTVGTPTGGSNAQNRAAERICASLANAIPSGSNFYASIATSTITGVIYRADGVAITGSETFGRVTGFDNAYATPDGDGAAVGLSGRYIPATTPTGGGSST